MNQALRVEWDIRSKAQVEEGKSHYRKARLQGREITDLSGTPIRSFRSDLGGILIREIVLEAGLGLRILDETGDRRLIWDSKDPDQKKETMKLFNEYLAKGWKAYEVDASGKKGRRIYGFDENAEEIFFDERSAAEKLNAFATAVADDAQQAEFLGKTKTEKLESFVKKFKEVVMLPKTYPG